MLTGAEGTNSNSVSNPPTSLPVQKLEALKLRSLMHESTRQPVGVYKHVRVYVRACSAHMYRLCHFAFLASRSMWVSPARTFPPRPRAPLHPVADTVCAARFDAAAVRVWVGDAQVLKVGSSLYDADTASYRSSYYNLTEGNKQLSKTLNPHPFVPVPGLGMDDSVPVVLDAGLVGSRALQIGLMLEEGLFFSNDAQSFGLQVTPRTLV